MTRIFDRKYFDSRNEKQNKYIKTIFIVDKQMKTKYRKQQQILRRTRDGDRNPRGYIASYFNILNESKTFQICILEEEIRYNNDIRMLNYGFKQ